MEFANTVTIERPAQDVFDFLAAFENVPKWKVGRIREAVAANLAKLKELLESS